MIRNLSPALFNVYYIYAKKIEIMRYAQHFCLLVFSTLLTLTLSAQWSTNLAQNLPITAAGEFASNPRIFTCASGKYFMFWASSMTTTNSYKLQLYNADGTKNWVTPMSVHNRSVGSALFKIDAFLDANDNLVTISTYTDGSNNKTVINKIGQNGTQLWSGASGIPLGSFSTAAYFSPTQHLYLFANDSLIRIDPTGTVAWRAPVIVSGQTTITAKMLENTDGTVSVVYFVNAASPSYGTYHYAKISATGTRLTVGAVPITTALSKFYEESALVANNAGDKIFVFTSEIDKGYVQKIVNDQPQYTGAGYELGVGGYAESIGGARFNTATNTLDVLYGYKTNGSPSQGLKYQRLDGTTFARGYINGQELFSTATNDIKISADVIISDPSNNLAFLLLNGDNTTAYKILNTTTGSIIASAPVCTTTTEKLNASLATYKNGQVVAFFLDDRNTDFNGEAYAQNISYTLGIEKLDVNSLTVYPNPTSATITFQSTEIISKISLYDQCGVCVGTWGDVNEISIEHLANGMYTAVCTNQHQQTSTQRIVKSNQ